ncbi:hypothetical protein ACFL27_05480 [candidate division CSSED10-310 bacterium]|uniref:HEAT repeat domain-containing protein n=1 Tax=candidate division CSSED10-310 bacterium TaxID=2855610 RepID=A0ABV6YU89_UNCC1
MIARMHLSPKLILSALVLFVPFLMCTNMGTAEETSFQLLSRNTPLTDLITLPTGAENAAAYYLEINKLIAPKTEADLEGMNQRTKDFIMALLVRGTSQRSCTFSSVGHPVNSHQQIFSLNQVQALYPVALLAQCGDVFLKKSEAALTASSKLHWQNEALALYEKILIYAHHLEQERLNLSMLLNALDFYKLGLQKFQNFYTVSKDPQGVEKVKLFLAANEELGQAIQAKYQTMISIKGDGETKNVKVNWKVLIDISRQDQDPLFRREALFLLGQAYQNFPAATYRDIDMLLIKKATPLPKRSELKNVLKNIAHNDPDPTITYLAYSYLF